jgi:hypothetical protein
MLRSNSESLALRAAALVVEIGSGQPLVYCNRGYATLNFDEAAGCSVFKCAR